MTEMCSAKLAQSTKKNICIEKGRVISEPWLSRTSSVLSFERGYNIYHATGVSNQKEDTQAILDRVVCAFASDNKFFSNF